MTKKHATSTLAVSFVVTVGAAVGCSPAQPEPELARNPPELVGTATPTVSVGTATAETPPDPEPPPEPQPNTAELPEVPKGKPGELLRNGDKCTWAVYPDTTCPPNTKCNPPAPQYTEVKCPEPDNSLPEAPAGAAVRIRPDGTCYYNERRPNKVCPPGMSCNPPPPIMHDVRCSDGK